MLRLSRLLRLVGLVELAELLGFSGVLWLAEIALACCTADSC